MNGAVCGFGASGTPCKLPAVWSPAACYLQWEPDENVLGPGNPGAFEFNDAANFSEVSNGEGIGRLHSQKGGNMLAVGGNVHFVLVTVFNKDSTTPAGAGPGPGGKTGLWWSPFSANGH